MAETEMREPADQGGMGNAEEMKHLGGNQPVERHSPEHTQQQLQHIAEMAVRRSDKLDPNDTTRKTKSFHGSGVDAVRYERKSGDGDTPDINSYIGKRQGPEVSPYAAKNTEVGQVNVESSNRESVGVMLTPDGEGTDLDSDQVRSAAARISGEVRGALASDENDKKRVDIARENLKNILDA